MGHHDVLAAVSCGTAIILCEHSNSERGFLTLSILVGGVWDVLELIISRVATVSVNILGHGPYNNYYWHYNCVRYVLA